MSEPWLDTAEAARRLGVRPQTLYAYVSRGQLRRRPGPDGRHSEYHPDDVAALAVRGRRARPSPPSDVIIPTAVTAITEQGPTYRGRLATELAGTTEFEGVAAWLWQQSGEQPWRCPTRLLDPARAAVSALDAAVEPAQRLLSVAAAARTADPLGHDLRPSVVAATARSLLAALVDAAGGAPADADSLARRLAVATTDSAEPGAVAALDAALVLLADHGLAASTLAARVAASARADPYAVEAAGLAVVSGRRHGAASRALEGVLAEISAGREPAAALSEALAPDGWAPGFGHPLYPDGDPRAARLRELLLAGPLAGACGPMEALLGTAAERGLPPANIDGVLAGLTAAIGAPVGTGELLFAIARSAGWIAHALEQYAEPQLLRPTAVYTGP